MHIRRVTIVLIYVVAYVLCAPGTGPYVSDKRVQAGGISFQPQMRYGRSGRGAAKVEEETFRNKVLVSPRAETFYSGPRYGKRSGKTDILIYPIQPSICDATGDFYCTYTGISNMYRCTKRKYPVSDDPLSTK